MVASSPAATVVGMPWSLAAGMKCVPISPFVVIPQIAKLAGQQPERPARARRRAARRTRRRSWTAGTTAGSAAAVAP